MIDNFEIIGQIIFLEMWLKTIHKNDSRIERVRSYADGLRFGLGLENKKENYNEIKTI